MYCRQCGAPIDDNSNFCKECGANTRGEPRKQPITEVCETYVRVVDQGFLSGGKYQFYAVVIGPNGPTIIAESPKCYKGSMVPNPEIKEVVEAFWALTGALTRDGWESVGRFSDAWWEYRFRRVRQAL